MRTRRQNGKGIRSQTNGVFPTFIRTGPLKEKPVSNPFRILIIERHVFDLCDAPMSSGHVAEGKDLGDER
jgi:hypothetical protein